MKQLGKINLIVEFSISKLGYTEVFTKIWEKMKMKMRKYGKMCPIFEFCMLKLGYVVIFMRILGKTFWPIFKAFEANQGKNENYSTVLAMR